jgi:hypothetical protein
MNVGKFLKEQPSYYRNWYNLVICSALELWQIAYMAA